MGSRQDIDLEEVLNLTAKKHMTVFILLWRQICMVLVRPKIAEEIAKEGLFTVLCKDYQPSDIWDWLGTHLKSDLDKTVAISTGSTVLMMNA